MAINHFNKTTVKNAEWISYGFCFFPLWVVEINLLTKLDLKKILNDWDTRVLLYWEQNFIYTWIKWRALLIKLMQIKIVRYLLLVLLRIKD